MGERRTSPPFGNSSTSTDAGAKLSMALGASTIDGLSSFRKRKGCRHSSRNRHVEDRGFERLLFQPWPSGELVAPECAVRNFQGGKTEHALTPLGRVDGGGAAADDSPPSVAMEPSPLASAHLKISSASFSSAAMVIEPSSVFSWLWLCHGRTNNSGP